MQDYDNGNLNYLVVMGFMDGFKKFQEVFEQHAHTKTKNNTSFQQRLFNKNTKLQ